MRISNAMGDLSNFLSSDQHLNDQFSLNPPPPPPPVRNANIDEANGNTKIIFVVVFPIMMTSTSENPRNVKRVHKVSLVLF